MKVELIWAIIGGWAFGIAFFLLFVTLFSKRRPLFVVTMTDSAMTDGSATKLKNDLENLGCDAIIVVHRMTTDIKIERFN